MLAALSVLAMHAPLQETGTLTPRLEAETEAIRSPTTWTARPNIILWLVDDLGWGNVGYNNRNFHTPNMNWMANEGITLTRHYSYPWCTPSRAALMSGRMPWDGHQQAGQRVPEELNMMAKAMQSAGYSTHHVGKWHLGIRRKWAHPMHRGFETSFGYLGGAEDYVSQITYSSEDWNCRGVDLQKNGKPAYGRNGTFSGDWFAVEIEEVLNAQKPEKPMFLYVALQAVHKPSPGPEVLAPFMTSYENLAGGKVYENIFKESAGLVTHADSLLGGLNQSLHEKGMWRNTLIVHLSDNGGQVTFTNDVQGNNWPLRGFKRTMFEGGVRTPAFLSGGALPRLNRGKKLNGYIHLADWYATLTEIAGLDWGPHAATHSMVPYLAGAVDESPRSEIILGAGNTGGTVNNIEAAIKGSWKLINGTIPCGWDTWQGPVFPNTSSAKLPFSGIDLRTELGPDQNCKSRPTTYLFNIKDDPNESNNVAATYPKKVEELWSLIKRGRTGGQPFETDHDRTNAHTRLQSNCETFRDHHSGFLGQYMDMDDDLLDEAAEREKKMVGYVDEEQIEAAKREAEHKKDHDKNHDDEPDAPFDATCVGLDDSTSAEWCGTQCARESGAFCPATKCKCKNAAPNGTITIPGTNVTVPGVNVSEVQDSLNAPGPKCKAIDLRVTDEWCNGVCAKMVCPGDRCKCEGGVAGLSGSSDVAGDPAPAPATDDVAAPVTAAPTAAPVTAAPTAAPVTAAPTAAPVTAVPVPAVPVPAAPVATVPVAAVPVATVPVAAVPVAAPVAAPPAQEAAAPVIVSPREQAEAAAAAGAAAAAAAKDAATESVKAATEAAKAANAEAHAAATDDSAAAHAAASPTDANAQPVAPTWTEAHPSANAADNATAPAANATAPAAASPAEAPAETPAELPAETSAETLADAAIGSLTAPIAADAMVVPTTTAPTPGSQAAQFAAAAPKPEQCKSVSTGTSDGWCGISCSRGFCPPAQCECSGTTASLAARPKANSNSATGCKSVSAEVTDEWCTASCAMATSPNECPALMCQCSSRGDV
jgi:arylsulfatase B